MSIKTSKEIIKLAFNLYNLDEIAISFNGGKDNTVMLVMILKYLFKKFGNYHDNLPLCVYFKQKYEFVEMIDFINQFDKDIGLNLVTYQMDIKSGLKKLKEDYPKIKCIFMGTRRSDPYSNHLTSFTATDDDWPAYMRVFPLLDWNYQLIWKFILTYQIPYCPLYNLGYTSISDISNTSKNPYLVYYDKYGNIRYKPAYYLTDESKERAGRNKIP